MADEINAPQVVEDAAERTQTLIRALWQRSQGVVLDRVNLLEEAAQASRHGLLILDLRTQASAAAHKLAGSLGMFGYPEGTTLARTLEAELERDRPDSAVLTANAAALRTLLFPPADSALDL